MKLSPPTGLGFVTRSVLVREVRNACVFACPYCPSRLSNSRAAQRHIKDKHEGMSHSWDVILGHAVHLAHHECFICRTMVLADVDKISHHLAGKHQSVKMGDYRKLEAQNLDAFI